MLRERLAGRRDAGPRTADRGCSVRSARLVGDGLLNPTRARDPALRRAGSRAGWGAVGCRLSARRVSAAQIGDGGAWRGVQRRRRRRRMARVGGSRIWCPMVARDGGSEGAGWPGWAHAGAAEGWYGLQREQRRPRVGRTPVIGAGARRWRGRRGARLVVGPVGCLWCGSRCWGAPRVSVGTFSAPNMSARSVSVRREPSRARYVWIVSGLGADLEDSVPLRRRKGTESSRSAQKPVPSRAPGETRQRPPTHPAPSLLSSGAPPPGTRTECWGPAHPPSSPPTSRAPPSGTRRDHPGPGHPPPSPPPSDDQPPARITSRPISWSPRWSAIRCAP
ncbi:hypothetical protein F4561_004464 [Lipingzhangella halophila]|uniref:Uncharacterized protein n=1 Tax=Lipingzhangella halophila TaxID=1783352 RepID=A0A7W7W5A5_9ACTN|nr:hypothetical protein [Lipingzhangella halophila]